MFKIIVSISCFLMMSFVSVESIYTHSVTSIEGVTKPLSAYQGKRLLIVTLPIQQNASNNALLHSLDSIRAAYAGSLIVIAVPSYEDGYTATNKEGLKQWYRSMLSADVIVTEGMYTRKTSGNQQHPFFKWLTDKDNNSHFNKDVDGPGNKFVVWTDGLLIGVLGTQTRIGSNTVNELLQ